MLALHCKVDIGCDSQKQFIRRFSISFFWGGTNDLDNLLRFKLSSKWIRYFEAE